MSVTFEGCLVDKIGPDHRQLFRLCCQPETLVCDIVIRSHAKLRSAISATLMHRIIGLLIRCPLGPGSLFVYSRGGLDVLLLSLVHVFLQWKWIQRFATWAN